MLTSVSIVAYHFLNKLCLLTLLTLPLIKMHCIKHLVFIMHVSKQTNIKKEVFKIEKIVAKISNDFNL